MDFGEKIGKVWKQITQSQLPAHTKPHPNPLLKEREQIPDILQIEASFLLEEKIV